MNNVAITFIASFLIWIMFFGLFLLWISDGKIRREAVLHALFASIIAWGFANMIKSFFPTLRPFEVEGVLPLTLTTPGDSSFPSSHAAVAFTLAVTIWLHDKKWGGVYIVAALLVGLGRVLSNVHYTTDIFGGALLGSVIAYTVEKMHLFKYTK
jgi:undecaprenyl-diphosphatase